MSSPREIVGSTTPVHYHTGQVTPSNVGGTLTAAIVGIAVVVLGLLAMHYLPAAAAYAITGVGGLVTLGAVIKMCVSTYKHLQDKAFLKDVYEKGFTYDEDRKLWQTRFEQYKNFPSQSECFSGDSNEKPYHVVLLAQAIHLYSEKAKSQFDALSEKLSFEAIDMSL